MTWDTSVPVRVSWPGGRLNPNKILYELNGPVMFTSEVGLDTLFVLKVDELEESDVFVACRSSNAELAALEEGRLSIRGVFMRKECWLIEADISLAVEKFQERGFKSVKSLVPEPGVALYPRFGRVPDVLESADALLSLRFKSEQMHDGSMPLSLLRGMVDAVDNFVRSQLLPPSLGKGWDYRFFDITAKEPAFASLFIEIGQPIFDRNQLLTNRRTKDLTPEGLSDEVAERNAALLHSIEEIAAASDVGPLSAAVIQENERVIDDLLPILPSSESVISSLEVGRPGLKPQSPIVIDRRRGQVILTSLQDADGEELTLDGTIVEVNGSSFTFQIKEPIGRITTCDPGVELFREMDRAGIMHRGVKLRIAGRYWPRTRRGLLTFRSYPTVRE